jgi:hypothetical protein
MPPITLNGDTGITTPMYGGSITANAVTPVNSFKNRIINSGFSIDQRNAGASQTITAAAALAYTVDRWYAYSTGANVTGQRVAGTGATQYRYRFTGAASVTKIGFAQRIEQLNSYDLADRTCTLSVDLANSLLTTVTWVASYANTADTFGTLASPTITQIATGTFTVTSTVTNYSAQIAVPAAATTGIQIEFSVAAQTSGTWTIGNAQLEVGSTATSFDYRPYGTELALCQRYYYKIGAGILYSMLGVGWNVSTTQSLALTTFPTTMRTSPSALEQTGTAGDYSIYHGGGSGVTCSAVPSFGIANQTNARVLLTVSSGLTANGGSMARAETANGYLAWSAEL